MKITSKDLIIPVYLNQRNVFDLLAMLEGGLSTVTKVSSVAKDETDSSAKVGSTFGLSDALSSLLKVNISASAESNDSNSTETTKTEDRYHTPASMLQSLRSRMKRENLLVNLSDGKLPKVGEIIEFTASIRINPLIHSFEKMIGVMDIAILFTEEEKPTNKKKRNQNQKSGNNENEIIKSQMESFLNFLNNSNTIDMVTDKLPTGLRAVITIDKEFLNDPDMNDLIDGEFKVIGKVIKSIKENEGAVDLQRKSLVGVMSPQLLEESFSGFREVANNTGMMLPELEFEIEGPVLQILPIAIFA